MKPGRNAPCPCGSGKKYKKCCMEKDGAAVIESCEFARRKMRKTEGDLVLVLMEYAFSRLGDHFLQEAFDDFLGYREIEFDDDMFAQIKEIFAVWAVFAWDISPILENRGERIPDTGFPWPSIAALYLLEKNEMVDAYQRRYIETACSQPYSFFQVIDVDPDNSLTVKDIFLNQTHVVLEKSGSRPGAKGSILFSKMICMDGVSLMLGCFPLLIPDRYYGWLIDLREEIKADAGGNITRESLLEEDSEFRAIFFDMHDQYQKKPMPELQNTDGDPLAPVKLIYELKCLPAEAFERLKTLSLDQTDEQLLSDASLDKSGNLQKVSFPWLKRGNEKHPDWENTVMGHIAIDRRKLTIDVNSARRAQTIKKEIKNRLKSKAAHQKSVMTSAQKMMEQQMAAGPSVKEKMRREEHDKLMQLPEVQKKIAAMAEKHWETWPDVALPALGNLTPRQAAKDPVGREKLEALLLHFEVTRDKAEESLFLPDIVRLRRSLGLDAAGK
jgi:hypothetical protein